MKAVYDNLGASNPRVLVGPRRGFDNAIISIGGGRVMVISTDPISLVPKVGAAMSAWLSVHLIASDFTSSGLSPQFASFAINLPPGTSRRTRDEYLKGLGDASRGLGIAIVSGNTGEYPGGAPGVVGGGTMFGTGRAGSFVTPAMAGTGDAIMMTKSAAVEAAAYLSCSFPEFTKEKIGRGLAADARTMLKDCTTVRDARAAATLGLGRDGVSSMHDATEGGILGALDEMVSASGLGILVQPGAVEVSKAARAVCAAFGIDPLTSLSEGALLMTCNPRVERELVGRLGEQGVEAKRVGTVVATRGLWVRGKGGTAKRLSPRADGYWRAYASSVAAGLK